MKKQIALFSLLLAALIAVPGTSSAQQGDKPGAKAAAPAKKKGALPLHGKVAAVDITGGTITIGQMTINVASDTQIHKDGKPATLADISVGDMVSGAYKKDDAGKNNAIMIRVGDKPADAPAKKKKADKKAAAE